MTGVAEHRARIVSVPAADGGQVEQYTDSFGRRVVVIERIVETPPNQRRHRPAPSLHLAIAAGLIAAVSIFAFLAMAATRDGAAVAAGLWGLVLGALIGGLAMLFGLDRFCR